MHNVANRVLYRFYTIYSIYVIYFSYVALYILVLSIMCRMKNVSEVFVIGIFNMLCAVLHLLFECHVICDRSIILW